MKSDRFSTTPLIMTALVVALSLGSCRNDAPEAPVALARPPRITPGYAGVVIPPNIAPLNFVINEPGAKYFARIRAASDDQAIEVASGTGKIIIPPQQWHTLLGNNAGK
ncbi:MAG: hypothetical protein JSW27_08130, partial [Phycisphaerales bacterium]